MDRDWILQARETRRTFSNATWVPLRASQEDKHGEVRDVGYITNVFACGSVAFPPQQRDVAEELSWGAIGIGHGAQPHAYKDGYYASIDQYQRNDKEPIGVELIFEHPQPVVGGTLWILNPDLVVALRLIKERTNWVRPEENFAVVAREILDSRGRHVLVEIKREYLIDYLAARNLSLRLSYYRQRVENVAALKGSPYEDLAERQEQRDGGRYELRVRGLKEIFGGSWAMFRMWRTDVDENEDAPVMGPESNDNTDFEKSEGERQGFEGIRVEGEFWRDEWIEHRRKSVRVRGDADDALPQFIVETDGTRMASADLNSEDIGRWLWFRSQVVNEVLGHRGFSLKWYTAETGGIRSTSGYEVHFGINSADLVTVHAYDIARLERWEQQIWAAHNVAPDGKVSSELLAAQVKASPAPTYAVETLLLESMRLLEVGFRKVLAVNLYTHDVDDAEVTQRVSRFASQDQASLLRLAKELIRVFSDRLDVRELRRLSTHTDKDKLRSNKLLQDILAKKIGADRARDVFSAIAGAYDMRVGDAHPTGSDIADALKLAGIDESGNFLRQGEQLISNFGRAVWSISAFLFGKPDK